MQRTLHPIASVDEFEGEGSKVIAEIDGHEIAVFRYLDEFYAVANFCPHQSGPLCEGALTGQTTLAEDGWGWEYDDDERYIACPWHNWMFDITTGKNAQDDRYAVPTYETSVEDGTVFVHR
jgi:nitrite reductase/ring-hydroxylating ferredoxin subunit